LVSCFFILVFVRTRVYFAQRYEKTSKKQRKNSFFFYFLLLLHVETETDTVVVLRQFTDFLYGVIAAERCHHLQELMAMPAVSSRAIAVIVVVIFLIMFMR